MNILQIAHCFPPESMTGSEIYAYNLSKELTKKHNVSVFYRINNPALKEYEVIKDSYDGLNVYKINHTFKDYDSIERIYSNREIEKRFLKVLDDAGPDVVHIQHLLFLSLGLIEEIKKRGIPVIFTLHDFWLMCPKGQLLRNNRKICKNPLGANCPYCLSTSLNPKVLIKKIFKVLMHYKIPARFNPDLSGIYKAVDLFIAPSNFLRNRFIELGLPKDKIIYLDNGMNTGLLEDTGKIRSGKIRFGFIGTLAPAKGVHVLIKAFNKIGRGRAILKIYGKPPANNWPFNYYNAIRYIARSNKDISFMGGFDNKEVAAVFKEIDVLVFSSIWDENSPLVLHEAILTKTPVLSSDVGGVKELIRDNENGMLYRSGDFDGLAALIGKILENPGIIENLKRNTVEIKNITTHCGEIEKRYLECMEKNRAAVSRGNALSQGISAARFSIVIVTYNSEKHIRQCLDSIFEQDFRGYEIILVDNASVDRTADIIDEYKDRVKIKKNKDNAGFSGAINMGIALSKGDYIVTMNPDVILGDDFLHNISRHIDSLDKDTGMIGVKILKTKTGNIIDSTGLVLSRSFRFFDRGSGEKDRGQYDKDTAILGPCAAAAVYKREMLDDVKIDGEYFDKDFFYLIEDFDIAIRAGKRGWKCLYLPGAVCYHERNGSGMAYKYRQYYAFRNRYLLIVKNIKIKPWFIIYFIIYDIPRFFFLFFTNFHTIGAVISAGRHLKTMLKKRKDAIPK
ncbi:MAG: glycosyltransferase [Candidatus Omnitrophota bacterium]|jgi:GT2 family glycosyltransferase/glycosyltransferase involved in cell wall biosynthesis